MIRDTNRFDAPAIDILSTSPRLEMLQIRLRQAGMRPVRAPMPLDPATPAPLLLDMVTADDPAIVRQFARDWAALGSSRLLIVLGEMPDALAAFPVLHLREVEQIRSLPTRLAIRQREHNRQIEAGLRAQTLQRLGTAPAAQQPLAAPRILYLGTRSHQFAPLKFTLSQHGIDVVAALTRHTAADYLSSGQFDGVIVHPSAAGDEASQFLVHNQADLFGRTSRLFLMEDKAYRLDIPAPVSDMLTDIFDAEISHDALAARLHKHVARPAAPAAGTRLSPKTHDKVTGLYARDFLEAHLQTLFIAFDETGAPLSMVTFQLSAPALDATALARLIEPHLRDNDLAARLDPAHISVVLPNTPYRGSVSFARRIEAAAQTTLDWRAVERRQFHTVRTLISATTAKRVLRTQQTA